MNKTVNINLAGISFHIDEDAFAKLQNYLNAIKQSLTDEVGREEILQDIEARIAELFTENMQNQNQVISLAEVNRVIEIMGQPEDYNLDEPEESTYEESYANKKLYRDPDDAKVAGVCSGIGHYINIDALWVRIIFIILSLATSGTFVVVYFLLWFLVPKANTTAEKLQMRGEPVNLNNIERKVREGFDNMAHKVKNVDYKKYGQKVNQTTSEFSEGVGNAFTTTFKIFKKLIGILLIFIAVSGLLSLVFALLSISFLGIYEPYWLDYVEMAQIGAPLWVISVLAFLSTAIPLFFLFMAGLKLMANHLRTIGWSGAIFLLVIWLLANFGLSFLVIKQVSARSFEEQVVISQPLDIQPNDTLRIKMRANSLYGNKISQDKDFVIKNNADGESIIYSENISVNLLASNNETAKIEVLKEAEGRNYKDAQNRANNILFETEYQNGSLFIDGYFTTAAKNGFYDQEVQVNLYLPENIIFHTDDYLEDYLKHHNSVFKDYQDSNYYIIYTKEAICSSCPNTTLQINQKQRDQQIKGDTLIINNSLNRKKDSLKEPAKAKTTFPAKN